MKLEKVKGYLSRMEKDRKNCENVIKPEAWMPLPEPYKPQ